MLHDENCNISAVYVQLNKVMHFPLFVGFSFDR